MKRREFLQTMAASGTLLSAAAGASDGQAQTAYAHRIGFGAWINDMRNVALPLQQWPAPQFDDHTVEGATRALETMGDAGYGYLDTFGLWATGNYPLDIVSAFQDRERNRRLERVFRAARKQDIEMVLPLGLFTWGYDDIIREDPEVRGVDHEGNPHAHAMCGAREKSWAYVGRLIETMLAQHDFGAVHLESADLGYCCCDQCVGQYGVVGYNARLNMRAADTIKSLRPDILVYVCPINWVPFGLSERGAQNRVPPEDMPILLELSEHIDILMDQGHRGRFLEWEDVGALQCDYGTSGGLWAYHGCRHDRLSYFLPYPQRACEHIRDHHANGARGCLYYQGPMVNPAVEINSAVAGRVMCDVTRDAQSVLEEVVEHYYDPGSAGVGEELCRIIFAAEEAYFGQWQAARFEEMHKLEMPGEFTVGVLFNTSPDPAAFLTEPFLDAEGRLACKEGLKQALADLAAIEREFDDDGRIERMTRCITTTLHLLTTVMLLKGEAWAN